MLSFHEPETIATIFSDKVFCYFGSWAGGRSGNGAFSVESINAKLCTHIAYSFIGLNTDGSVKLLDSGSNCSLTVITTFYY